MSVVVVADPDVWMESGALRQLESIDRYPGVELTVGLPDLHGGRSPVGFAAAARGHVYPYLIGGDVGCGMALFQTALPLRKFRAEKFEKILSALESLDDEELDPDLERQAAEEADGRPAGFGSLGGGNHFAELQKIERVDDAAALAALGVEPDRVLMLVHTGSRGVGPAVLAAFNRETGYAADEPEAELYLERHDRALSWAALNRQAVARRLMSAAGLKSDLRPLLDSPHNFVERRGEVFVHRKGAVSSLRGPVVLPGSRGSWSYLLKPDPDSAAAAFSLSHGAGRKWARSTCRERLGQKADKAALSRTALGGRVVCRDVELLRQETPEAYKNVDTVLASLVSRSLASVTAVLRPLLTYKG
ncbi:MAG: RNA ligase RtcB family protein [Deltaproteobacteria bacterium]|jgi:release factor H-coupled RctB family protein|nr:RNA ligase RtcB family protein [Deltaproteobacteria bacterium]